jgi:hypothetical protein
LGRNDQIAFGELKKQIVAMMQKSYPGINPDISEWRGQEITDFQEELVQKINAHVSEKWFYTHMKTGSRSLPRIDILNILSRYAGYANWDDFAFRNFHGPDAESAGKTGEEQASPGKENRSFFRGEYGFMVLIPLTALVLITLLVFSYRWFSVKEYRFCFRDADTKELIRGIPVRAEILEPGNVAENVLTGTDGTLRFRTGESRIKMAVSAPYYMPDTVVRIVRKLDRDVYFDLRPDDYALMIRYFSTGNVDDWSRRRARLNEIFSDDAMICQVIREKDAKGTVFYDKQEFIDRMSVPAGSLRNIEVLGSTVRDGKIKVLRFRVKP